MSEKLWHVSASRQVEGSYYIVADTEQEAEDEAIYLLEDETEDEFAHAVEVSDFTDGESKVEIANRDGITVRDFFGYEPTPSEIMADAESQGLTKRLC